MRSWPAVKWKPKKSTRINYNWDKVVLPEKVMPELKIVAQAQTIYDMGIGIPPSTRVIRECLTGREVVISDNYQFNEEKGGDDFSLARATMLIMPERLPEWVINNRWNIKHFRSELNTYANQIIGGFVSPVSYWWDLKAIQAAALKKSGPEAVLALTHNILLEMYLACCDSN